MPINLLLTFVKLFVELRVEKVSLPFPPTVFDDKPLIA